MQFSGEVSFASDNGAGAHPAVVEAIVSANRGHAVAYGDDPWTRRAVERFRTLFDAEVEVLFTWGGTGANVVGLQTVLRPWEAVICTDAAHINVDECGAPERFTGCKLIDLPHRDGKLTPEAVRSALGGVGDQHHVQPRVISITQSTEHGTLYTVEELAELVTVAHDHGLLVHVDGARIANAVAALGVDVTAITTDLGVDVLSFGGTKNGLMFGEAVIFFERDLARAAPFVRKQAAQLPSKMRFVAAQFEALLTDDLWLRSAGHANAMAARLGRAAGQVPGVEVVRPPEVNAVFARLPHGAIAQLQSRTFFWVWDEATDLVRWMTSFDTGPADVDEFVALVAEVVAAHT